jgi:hypothetical protein
MRLKDYGKIRNERKEYIHQSGLLIAGVDMSKAKHDAGALLRYAGIFAGLPSDQHSYCDLIY